MKSGISLRRLLSTAAAVVVGGIAPVGLTPSAHAAPAPLPDVQLRIVVTPQKPTYAVGDAITTTFVVKNAGTVTATNVRPIAQAGGGCGDLGVTRTTGEPDQPFDLAPGATKSLPWAGTIDERALEFGTATGDCSFTNDAGEANAKDNYAAFELRVPGGTTTMRGKVVIEPPFTTDQPGVAGAKITVIDRDGKIVGRATSDSAGQYSIAKVPVGNVTVTVADWTVMPQSDQYYLNSTVVGVANIYLVAGSHKTATAGAVPALPVTGSRTGLMFAVGAGVLLVGAVAVLVGRRRRNRFVAPD